MDYFILLWGMERAHVTDWCDQKIPDSVVKNTFLGEVETAIRLGIKAQFGDLAWQK